MPIPEGVRTKQLAAIIEYAFEKDRIEVRRISYISELLEMSERKLRCLINILVGRRMLEYDEEHTAYILNEERGNMPLDEEAGTMPPLNYTKAERFLLGYYRKTGQPNTELIKAIEVKALTQ